MINTRVIINGVSRDMTPNEIEEANKMLILEDEPIDTETTKENK